MFSNANITKDDFYQSKYDYYQKFLFWLIIVSCFGIVSYLVSDIQLFAQYAREHGIDGDFFDKRIIIPRCIGLVPMIAYIFISKKVRNYKIMVPLSYFMLLLVLGNTMWSVYYLPIKDHFAEGSIVMQILFMSAGFASPFLYATVANILFIVLICVTNPINHYPNFDILISLNLPCTVGISAAHFFMEKLYVDHYLTAKKLEFYSIRDPLTNAFNRNIIAKLTTKDKHFNNTLQGDVGIIMFDIDFFKKVNDEYGHAGGDKILQFFSRLVKKFLKEGDYLIRWGGEEFVVLLQNRTVESTKDFAEMIRKKVEASETGVCKVTISAGVTLYQGGNYQATIDNADKAMYTAKTTGRNKIEIL